MCKQFMSKERTVVSLDETFVSAAFRIICETPPGNNAELQYIVMNLPSHINEN
jgi:hypothetical protein